MKHLPVTILLLGNLLITGCATSPVPAASRRQAPASRVSDTSLLQPSAQRSVRFTIIRDSGYVASAASIQVFIDGRQVARLATSETVTIYVSPGPHLVGARFSWGFSVPPAEREFLASPQKPTNIRITTDQNGNLDLKPESGYL